MLTVAKRKEQLRLRNLCGAQQHVLKKTIKGSGLFRYYKCVSQSNECPSKAINPHTDCQTEDRGEVSNHLRCGEEAINQWMSPTARKRSQHCWYRQVCLSPLHSFSVGPPRRLPGDHLQTTLQPKHLQDTYYILRAPTFCLSPSLSLARVLFHRPLSRPQRSPKSISFQRSCLLSGDILRVSPF